MNGVVELDAETEQPVPSKHCYPASAPAPVVEVKTEAPVVETKPKYTPPTVKEVPAPVEDMESTPPDLVVGAVDEDEPVEEMKPVEKDNRRKPAKK
jgi:hypothetical protein